MLADLVNDIPMTKTGSGTLSLVSGKGGSAHALRLTGACELTSNASVFTPYKSDEFSLIGWVRPIAGSSDEPTTKISVIDQSNSDNRVEIQFVWEGGVFSNVLVDAYNASSDHVSTSTPISWDASTHWLFFALIYSEHKFGIYIGESGAYEQTATITLPTTTQGKIKIENILVDTEAVIEIDELAYWNKALTVPDQVEILYNGGDGVTYPPPDL